MNEEVGAEDFGVIEAVIEVEVVFEATEAEVVEVVVGKGEGLWRAAWWWWSTSYSSLRVCKTYLRSKNILTMHAATLKLKIPESQRSKMRYI